jgi:protocatechuate 3,4-dioxygenase beta subunit
MKLHLVGLSLALITSIGEAQDSAGTIRGVVRNETGRPVEYALIALDPDGAIRQTRTDRDGRFTFRGVTPGSRTIRVTFVGYRPNEQAVQVSRGVVDVDIVLQSLVTTLAGVEVTARRSGLFGSVIARDSLLPVPDARIEVLGGRMSDTTGTDGAFNFPTLKPGTYIVRVRHTKFESRNISIIVPAKGAAQLDLVVERGLLSRDAHMEQLYRELDSRVHWQGITSALISREDLKGEPTTGLDVAIVRAPGFMKASFYPARDGWEGACLFVDGVPRPGATISDFAIDEIEAIEVYGPPMNRSDPTRTLESRWPPRAMCGRVSGGARPAFERSGNASSARLSSSAIRVQFVVVWLRQR